MQPDLTTAFQTAFASLPLVAILRGLRPDEAQAVGNALYDAGFRLIEVPMNSPEPLESIALLAKSLPRDCLIGAGTVLSTDVVAQVQAAGGQLIVMPHADTDVIRAARAVGMICVPGVATPTEAFAAFKAGANALKLFPAELITPTIVRAMRAVLPPALPLLPVGGITPENMDEYRAAGVAGFGLGSALYRPGMDAATVGANAGRFAAAWH
jgi:2-dehydro-3-deoxyphosphogalactonate aldolase